MKIRNITEYGARPDGTLCTQAVQAAIDDCFLAGGGTVEVPAGDFLIASVRLRSNVTLHLLKNARLLGVRDPELYSAVMEDTLEPLDAEKALLAERDVTQKMGRDNYFAARWSNGIIRACHARNIAIIGEEGSEINGQNCYDAQGEEGYRGPHGINMHDCENVRLCGYTVHHSANWANTFFRSRNIAMENVTVLGGHDGAHFRGCDNVHIDRCRFFSGDDCVAGFDNLNVTVTNCEINTACNSFRFGGTNVFIKNCHIFGPARYLHRGSLTLQEQIDGVSTEAVAEDGNAQHRYNMLSAFTYFADFSREIREQPGNIVLQDCVIENTDRLLHYNFSGNETWQKHRPLRSIRFDRVKAVGIRLPLNLYGDEAEPVECVFRDSTVAFAPDVKDQAFMHAAHFERIVLDHVNIEKAGDAPTIRRWTEGEIVCRDCAVNGGAVTDAAATEPFFAQSI